MVSLYKCCISTAICIIEHKGSLAIGVPSLAILNHRDW